MSTFIYSSNDDTPYSSRIDIFESSDYDSDSEFDEYEDIDSSIDGIEYSSNLHAKRLSSIMRNVRNAKKYNH